jgi:hypothetical protein
LLARHELNCCERTQWFMKRKRFATAPNISWLHNKNALKKFA